MNKNMQGKEHTRRENPRSRVNNGKSRSPIFTIGIGKVGLIFVGVWFFYLLFIQRHLGSFKSSYVPHKRDAPPSLKTVNANEIDAFNHSSSPYAYAFVIGGINEERPGYKGFLYNILLTVSLLREFGSTADFCVWTQLSPDSSLGQSLPAEDLRLLTALGIHVHQLKKPSEHSFAQLVYEKFRPLQMTDYRRVMFLDADIMPLVNLDYLFQLSDSDEPILRPNLIMASRAEPCNAGMFILAPEHGAWDRVQQIVQGQSRLGSQMPYPHFDWNSGWGHNFKKEGDQWEAIKQNGTHWKFHAGHSDQGLLFYYTKYIRQDVSIVIGDHVQNWVHDTKTGMPKMEKKIEDLQKYSPSPIVYQYDCGHPGKEDKKLRFMCKPVYRDFVHFFGKEKPWQSPQHKWFKGKREGDIRTWEFDGDRQKNKDAAYRVWWRKLADLNEKYSIGLDIEHWDKKHEELKQVSPLGYMAMYSDHAKMVAAPKKTIAYALSFIKCGDFQTHSAGLTDASLVLRHSVHQIHQHSKYDYKMYAIVHRQAEACSEVLHKTGFEVMVVDPPVHPNEIQGEYLRKKIHKEWCCGSDEFIKLYAYTIPEEVIVHVDIDFAFYKPMDHLFDALLYNKDTPEGRAARNKIELERPSDKLPDQIDAFITRDWPQVAPNKFPPAYQAGFLVARHNPSILEEFVAVIKQGNYTEGWGWSSGWGGKGYGGYVGAMAMQGVVAYYYDHIRPNTAVELNQCRFNHMGMDVLYRKPPNFQKKYATSGMCAPCSSLYLSFLTIVLAS